MHFYMQCSPRLNVGSNSWSNPLSYPQQRMTSDLQQIMLITPEYRQCNAPRPFDWEANDRVTGSNKSLFCFIPARASSARNKSPEPEPRTARPEPEPRLGTSGAEQRRWGSQWAGDTHTRLRFNYESAWCAWCLLCGSNEAPSYSQYFDIFWIALYVWNVWCMA